MAGHRLRTTPTFSVAMATYNGARHLAAQLDSIAAQSLLPIELQIGDDGSTDETEDVVADFARGAPFEVVFHRNPTRLGYGENFLEAARRCSGDWIAFSDQDDVWLPEKLATCAETLEAAANPDILMIAHSGAVVDGRLAPTGARIPSDIRDEVRGPLQHVLTWSHYGFAQLFRRELVCDIPLSPRVPTIFTDIDAYPHDVWISALANVLGSTLHIARDLTLYRRHESSLTETGKAPQASALAALRATGAEQYRHLASVCREAAACFDVQSAAIAREDWKQRMADGAIAYRRLADALDARSSVYESRSRLGRLGSVLHLAARPGYFGLAQSSFGLRALAKDLAASLMPAYFAGEGAAR